MANIALQSAATSLSALNTKLDVIANNLANINTTGFKASRVNFQDLLYIERAQPGVENATGDKTPTGLYVGLGVKVAGTQQNFEQGTLVNTGNPTDVAIEGLGFFRVTLEDGVGNGVGYTRAGNFTVNDQGELVLGNDQGYRLDPPVQIPADAVGPVRITTDGHVLVTEPGGSEPTEVGTITLSAFVNPAGLKPIGGNLWIETGASGPPLDGDPGTDNRGMLRQGHLEGSNVDPTSELVEMIRTQRAFEMNSNSIKAADDTLRAVAQLRR
jgi:flagellar basal-body rod protein FlgG